MHLSALLPAEILSLKCLALALIPLSILIALAYLYFLYGAGRRLEPSGPLDILIRALLVLASVTFLELVLLVAFGSDLAAWSILAQGCCVIVGLVAYSVWLIWSGDGRRLLGHLPGRNPGHHHRHHHHRSTRKGDIELGQSFENPVPLDHRRPRCFFNRQQTKEWIVKPVRRDSQEPLYYDLLRRNPDLAPFLPDYAGFYAEAGGGGGGGRGAGCIRLSNCEFPFLAEPYSILILKMGVRTYREDVAARHPSPRLNLYTRMMAKHPTAPNSQEHAHRSMTLARFLEALDAQTSSPELGFRLEAARFAPGLSMVLADIPARSDVARLLPDFIRSGIRSEVDDGDGDGDGAYRRADGYLARLRQLRKVLTGYSDFFPHHELIGTKLVLIHNRFTEGVWMINFSHCRPLPSGIAVTHSDAWQPGNHEDGFLTGLDNLIGMFGHLKDLTCATGRDQLYECD